MYHILYTAEECDPFNPRFNKPRHENLAIIARAHALPSCMRKGFQRRVPLDVLRVSERSR